MRTKGFALIPFLLILALLAILGFTFLKKDSFLLQQKSTWHLNLGDKGMTPSASLRLRDNKIYVSSYYSPLLLEIDGSSGQVKRKFRVEEHTISSDLSDNIFYYNIINKKNNSIHALDVSSGVEKWAKTIESPEEKYAPTSIKATRDRVYLNEGFGKISAFNPENGGKLWTFETKLPTDTLIDDVPIVRVGEKVVIVGFDGGMVYALNPVTGTELWKFNTSSVVRPEEILVSGEIVYVAAYRTAGDAIYSLETKTGAARWQVTAEGNPNTSMSSDGEIFYIAKAYGYLQAISNKDGKELWRIKTEHFPTNLAISNGVLYFARNQYDEILGDKSYLHAVDSKTGGEIWELKLKDLISGLDSTNGIVYFLKRDGELTALK